MNRLYICLLVLVFPLHLSGQMFPLSSHYLNDALDINPAYAGSHNAMSASLMYRNQWVGFRDAPKSYLLSVHAPLDNDRIGLGFLVEKNSIGINKETSLMGNYAYRMELQNGRLALGIGFGITVYNVAWNELIAFDANDLQLMENPATTVLPTFSLGTYYYTKKYYIGISIPLFLSHEQDNKTGKYKIGNNFSGCNYFLTGGYEIGIASNVKLLPSLLLKYHPDNSIQIDINALMNLNEKVWLGAGYRNSNILVGMIQCQLNYQIRMAYSYDYCFGSIGKYMNGSHEIVLNYKFRYKTRVMGPRHF
jgi:type IX secretion system PorP/SprF family membrane protein